MWTCYRSEYIEDILKEIQESNETVYIWQKDNNREQYEGYIEDSSNDKYQLKLYKDQKNVSSPINIQQGLFFHIRSHDLLFKRDVYSLEDDSIFFKIPLHVKLRDLRLTKRFLFKYQDYKNIDFSIHGEPKIYSEILTDVSLSGVSFVCNQSQRADLKKDKLINILKLTDQKLEKEHEAKIIYVTPYSLSKESYGELLQVGLSFTESLESINYNSINSIIKKKQNRIQGLQVNSFNGLHPEELDKIIMRIRTQDAAIATSLINCIEDIDKLRYLTTQAKQEFFGQIDHNTFAIALRLSSKELILDLFTDLSKNMLEDFLHKMSKERAPSEILKAQKNICEFIRQKEAKGELVLNARSFSEYV